MSLQTVLTLAGRYGARISRAIPHTDPLPLCDLCSDQPAGLGVVNVSSTDVDTHVCWDHVAQALVLVATAADEARDRHPELMIEVTDWAAARVVVA